MKRAEFRFYAELNDFLAPSRRGVAFTHAFSGRPSVKDVIESLGVPHAEVDLVLADGEPVDFSWTVRDGVRVSAYPVFESIDITPVTRVRPAPLRETRFVVDGHLGRLARYLRMAGLDARWPRDAADEELARVAADERRVLLTRDRGLLKRRAVSHGYWIRELDPELQLAEVVRRFDLSRCIDPFRRCIRCNDVLEPVRKEAVAEKLPPRVRERHDEYRRCPACGRIYWPGSHHRRMSRLMARVLAQEERAPRSSHFPSVVDARMLRCRNAMHATDIDNVRSQLQRRRRLILEASRRTAGDIDKLRGAERDPEIEEASQSEQQQYNLSQIGEAEQREIAQIDAALQRLEAGAYGVCRDCGEEIDAKRLEALPFVLDCAECASRREEAQALERERAGKPRFMIPQ